jgi:phage-related protein
LNSATDDAEKEGLEWRIGKNNLKFEMLDAFWEDNTETIIYSPTGGMANGDSLIIDNDSYIECYPIIRITPYEINSDFTIRNITTGAAFIIGSGSFVPGSEFIIDSQKGTIYLESSGSQIEMSSALADGSGFIKLIPGENEIQYSSVFGEVDIEIEYRRRYVV